MIEQWHRAWDILSEGLPWALLGAVTGVAMEIQSAHAAGRVLGLWDYVAKYVIGMTVGIVAFLLAPSLGLSNTAQEAGSILAAMLGSDAVPVLKDVLLRVLRRS